MSFCISNVFQHFANETWRFRYPKREFGFSLRVEVKSAAEIAKTVAVTNQGMLEPNGAEDYGRLSGNDSTIVLSGKSCGALVMIGGYTVALLSYSCPT